MGLVPNANLDMFISDAVRTHCQHHGINYYSKRLMVAKALQELNCCTAADEIFSKIYSDGKKVSFSAVYNTLNWLIEREFVEKQDSKAGRALYVISPDC